MWKIFSLFLIVPILFCSQMRSEVKFFNNAKSIEFYIDGQVIENVSQKEIDKFEQLFCKALEGARTLPAYGVSLDENVKEAAKEGVWVKFIFEEKQVSNEMPFDSLLIKICKGCKGINVYRGNDGVFGGRNFYLQLESNFNKVYDYVLSLEKEEIEEVELEKQELEETSIMSEENDEKQKNKKNGVIKLESAVGKSQRQILDTLENTLE